ncbi:MAG: HU family DNA-binding protein [Prevotellaceae bacterium]|jgi:predicted histone-like DNA-binding protein|nr:HU family DNA-binding protein [Prevotellaceae bacterium]
MSILLNSVQRVNPRDVKAPKKWYFVQHVSAQLSETDVAQFISDETTLNEGEALMAIRQLHKVLLRALLNGQSVKLGNWGYFGLSINSEGVEKKSDLTVHNIKHVNVTFQPGEELKAELQKATFVSLDKIVLGSKADDGNNSGGGGNTGGGGNDGDDDPYQ